MLMWHGKCSITQIEVQIEEVTLQAIVCTINTSRECGEICFQVLHSFIIVCLISWKIVVLDPSDKTHIAALHYVYKHRINASLGLFKNGHN